MNNMKIVFLIVFLVVLTLFENVNAQVPWLHTDGKWIKDSDGNVVFLHGTNFEGYESSDHNMSTWFNHTEEDYEKIASMGFNVVRLPIVWQYIEPVEGYYEELYFTKFVDKDIEFAKKHGLYIILDFHKWGWSPYFAPIQEGGIPNGLPSWMVSGYPISQEGKLQSIKDFFLGKGPNGTEATPENPSMKDRMIAVWKYIAERYKDDSTIAGYDLFNEAWVPDLPSDYVYDFHEILIDNISVVDNNHIFVYEIVMNGSTVTNTTTKIARLLNRDNIIFSFHEYLPEEGYHDNFTKLEERVLAILENPKSNPIKNWNIPVYVGEFGCVGLFQVNDHYRWLVKPNGSQFMDDLPVLLTKYNFHWTVWSYSNGNSPFRIVYPDGSERREWTDGLVIPYLRRSSIPPTYSYFDQKTKNFKVIFDGVGNVEARIYVPYRHYPGGFTVRTNASVWGKSWNETDRILTVQATLDSAVEITITPMKILVDYNKFEGISNLTYGAHVGIEYYQDFYCAVPNPETLGCDVKTNQTLLERIKPLNISMMRFQLGKEFYNYNYTDFAFCRYDSTVFSLCSCWNDITHSCDYWNWTRLDILIEAIQGIGAEPIICIGGGSSRILNESLLAHHAIRKNQNVPWWSPPGLGRENYILLNETGTFLIGTFYPPEEDFSKYAAEIVKHVNIDKGYNVKYWEVWNEPRLHGGKVGDKVYSDFEILENFTRLFNTTIKAMHDIDPNILIGNDRSNYAYLFDYLLENVSDVGFMSLHKYDSWGHPMVPYNTSNPDCEYYPPNNQNGWMKDEYILNRAEELSGNYECGPQWSFGCYYSPEQMRSKWKEKYPSQDIEVIVTETNLNSAFHNGTDPRQQNIFGAVWYAVESKALILNGTTNSNYFVLMSLDKFVDNPEACVNKLRARGALGFGMINASYPYLPWAPYWTNYLLANYIPEGSFIYDSKSSDPSVDALAVKTDDSNNILLINKVKEQVNVTVPMIGFTAKNATLYLLDNTTYVQYYDPVLDGTVIEKSNITNITLPVNNVQNFTFNGYTVAILQAFPLENAPYIKSIPESLDLTSVYYDQDNRQYYTKSDCTGENVIEYYADSKPSRITQDEVEITEDPTLSLTPSWKYESNLVTVKFSCE